MFRTDTGLFQPFSASTILRVLGIALAVRLAWAAFAYLSMGSDGFFLEDSLGYIAEAASIAKGDTWLGFATEIQHYDAGYMPLPLFFMAVTVGGADDILGYILIQCAIDAVTCVLIGLLAAEAQDSWFFPAGLIAAFNPTQIVLSTLVLTDTLFLFFVTLSLLSLVRAMRDGKTRSAALVGLFLGLAFLTRSMILLWVPVALSFLFIVGLVRESFPGALGRTILAGMIVAVLIAPVSLRNHHNHGTYALTNQGGSHLLFWVVPSVWSKAGFDIQETKAEARARLDAAKSGITPEPIGFESDRIAREVAVPMLFEQGVLPIIKAWVAGAAGNMAVPAAAITPPVRSLPHPSFYEGSGGPVSKLLNLITDAESRPYILSIGISAVLLIPWIMGLPAGILVLAPSARLFTLVLVLWLGYVLVITGPVLSPKYRLPLEPAWIIFLCASWHWFHQRIQRRL